MSDRVTCRPDRVPFAGKPRAELWRLEDARHGLRIAVLPEDGGEIVSWQVRLGTRWHEVLYRALDFTSTPPDGWDGRAPLLWPCAGRSFTPARLAAWRRTGRKPRRNSYLTGGREFAIPGHGFARRAPWALEEYGYGAGEAWLKLLLRSDPATRALYPFDFTASVLYTLAGGAVKLRYEITAGDNPRPMPFTLGNHISFNLPFTGRGKFEDCSIRSSADVILRQNPLCLLSGEREPVDLSRPQPLSRVELCDTAFGGLRHGRAWFELRDPRAFTLRVTHAESTPGRRLAADANLLFVTWGTPLHRYFCPEPWIGLPNGLNDPRGRVDLPPGRRFAWDIVFDVLR
jgi:galactose mutarotase-like enzyme